ncbi:kinase-like protein [Xylariaceae sp. FL1272]|nr:kinase-like protein [Xylariaceae sp. FL1272]
MQAASLTPIHNRRRYRPIVTAGFRGRDNLENACLHHSESMSADNLGCQCPIEASRYRIVHDLENASKSDLLDSSRRFILRDDICSILDSYRVGQHLRLILTADVCHRLITYISPHGEEKCHCQHQFCTGSRLIFASLISLAIESRMHILLDAKQSICDTIVASLKRVPGHPLFAEFTELQWELFENSYWRFQSHHLHKTDLGRKDFETLDDRAALPLSSAIRRNRRIVDGINESSTTLGESPTIIQHVTFHTGEQELGEPGDSFALKTFRKQPGLGKIHFEREAHANRNAPRHDRLTPLLKAFEYRNEFHLLFPWAERGDLFELWRENPGGLLSDEAQTSSCNTKWLLDECLGIAEGLAAMHTRTDARKPQLHADIKPRNILCFQRGQDSTQSVVLKLADLGYTRSVEADGTLPVRKVTHTKTYRPPDHDIEETIQLKYDVWCLGCVYLEFITWAIVGSHAIDTFRTERENEASDPHTSTARGEDVEDTFFKKRARVPGWYHLENIGFQTEKSTEIVNKKTTTRRRHFQINRKGVQISGEIKTSVTQHISRLKQKKACATEFQAFLDFIERRMLAIDVEARASSEEVTTFIRGLTNQRHLD